VSLHRQHHELVPASPASCTSLALMVTKIKSESVKLHAAVALYTFAVSAVHLLFSRESHAVHLLFSRESHSQLASIVWN